MLAGAIPAGDAGAAVGAPAGGLRRLRPRLLPPRLRCRGLAAASPCGAGAACGLGLPPRPRPPREPRLRGFLGDPSAPPPPPASSGLLRNSLGPNTDTPTLKTRSVPMIAPIFLSRGAAANKIPATAGVRRCRCRYALPIPCDLHPVGRRETGSARNQSTSPPRPVKPGHRGFGPGDSLDRGILPGAFPPRIRFCYSIF